MKIIADRNIPFLEGRISNAELIMTPADKIDKDLVRDADAIITRTRTHCDAKLLEDSKVRLVATATIGTDHIDIPWCETHGVTIRNAPGCNAPGVALYVWASLLRNGFDPDKSVLGVVGHGHVGSIVAEWGRELGANVLVCDPLRKEEGFTDFEYLPLEEVLSQSDAVTIHTPLTYSGLYPTYHLIGEDSLKEMKTGSILVNAARGAVIDTSSVISAIKCGDISKAIIDTWEGEPDIDRELLRLADVATCHIAGYSVEGKQRATRMVLESVRDVLGLEVDLSGLAENYSKPLNMDAESIVSAYDPTEMTNALKSDPLSFEYLRNNYSLHYEFHGKV
ncbi:MAG: 4-phosphoerythronate dehydrogenase [Muribaculum sp.]|nr:4-phosphoerythronate dehydrogenase [Muribaculum sp.]